MMACGGGSTPLPSHDATPEQPPDNHNTCMPRTLTASCTGSAAAVNANYFGGAGSHSLCGAEVDIPATCSGGCAVTGTYVSPDAADFALAGDPQALCAETPDAQLGDPCTFTVTGPAGMAAIEMDLNSVNPCLPTRAQLAGDGTVTSQAYLACVANACTAAPAPTITKFLKLCDAATLAMFETLRSTGVFSADPSFGDTRPACLLAFDNATQKLASGVTQRCIGDWQCPEHALCDDQITRLGGGDRIAVCKPGPRGTLTPAMLAE
jgi:hypothetical protein